MNSFRQNLLFSYAKYFGDISRIGSSRRSKNFNLTSITWLITKYVKITTNYGNKSNIITINITIIIYIIFSVMLTILAAI
jgi:hypothetical protein